MNILKVSIIASIMTSIISCGSESKQTATNNPLLEEQWETPYNIAPFEQIEADHYTAAFDKAYAELNDDVNEIINSKPTFESVIVALDRSGERLRVLKDLFEMSEASISSDEYRRVSEVVTPGIAAAWDSVYMNDQLYKQVKSVYIDWESGNLELTQIESRLLNKIHNKFVRGGAELSAEDKALLAQYNRDIALLSTKFTHNLLAENDRSFLELGIADLGGIPQEYRNVAREEAKRRGLDGKWVLTLNPASMIPFLTYAGDRSLREKIYKAYLNRGANGDEYDNREIVRQVTILRQKRAQLLGYENHADYVISEQMAGTPEAVYNLLDGDGVWNAALDKAQNERETLIEQFNNTKENKGKPFEAWDWWFYTDKVRNTKYKISSSELRNYFSIGGVRTGAFTLANRLYGVDFRPTTAPIYDPDCTVYEVIDADNKVLGVLYLDLFVRPSKGQGAWCGNLREQSYNDAGERVLPVVAIVCNFPRPVSNTTPSALSMEQVETFFHEFGHALHFLMQDVKFRTLAPVEGDFVEFPSQVMENWAFEPEMLRMYAVHNRTGKVMTDQMIENIVNAQTFNQGYETLSVVSAALLDLDLQTLSVEQLENIQIEDFADEVLNKKRGLINEIEPRYHLTNFAHLFTYDYSAGYYFYMWSEVLDKEVFTLFKNRGDLFSKEVADKLKHEVLERGGERSGKEMVQSLIGRELNPDAMMKSRGLK